jgi:N-acylneuraminate cytidylyltransferase
MNIAIIPARGGSKRIVNKNIKFFFGKPIIYWTIMKLKKTKIFDKIYVSTDSIKIYKAIKKFNCDILFPRPKNLSNDYAKTIDVIKYEIKKINNKKIKNICCMYPTAPLTSVKDLIKGYNYLKKNKKNFIISSCKANFDIERVFYKKKKFILKNPHLINNRSQDLRMFYHDAGQFYWASKKNWERSNSIFSKFIPLEVESLRFCDINNKEDWHKAEILFKSIKKFT